jgi:hypothetical protein
MGNRAVITTRENWRHCGVGVYLHWNGGRDSVEAFLKYCDLKGYRSPDTDCYGWARLCQVIGNFFGGSTSIGIDTLWHLDRDNGDNGVYIIKDWKIEDRYYFDRQEQNEYDLNEMLLEIDKRMPEKEQIGEFLKAKEVMIDELAVGDEIVWLDWNGNVNINTILGIGEKDKIVNGHDVEGVPYMDYYNRIEGNPANNCNNYLTNKNFRLYKKVIENQ